MWASMSVSVFGNNYTYKYRIYITVLHTLFEIKYQIDLNAFCITSLNIHVIHQHRQKRQKIFSKACPA